MALRIFWKS